MPDFDWLFGNPRDLARTPTFVPQQDSLPPQDTTPRSAPLPPLPRKPKKGIWSQIAGEAVGILAPAIGDRIQYGDYPEQMREYQQDMERRKLQADLDYKANQANELRTRSNANVGREALYGAQQLKALREDPSRVTSLAPGHTAFDPITREAMYTAPPLPPQVKTRQKISVEKAKQLGIEQDQDGSYYIPESAMGNYISGLARGTATPDKKIAGYAQAYMAQGLDEEEAYRLGAKQFLDDATANRSRVNATANRANAGAANTGNPDRNRAAEVKRLADRIQADETTGVIDNAIRNAEQFYEDIDVATRQLVVDELKGRKVRATAKEKPARRSLTFGGGGAKAASAPVKSTRDPIGIR